MCPICAHTERLTLRAPRSARCALTIGVAVGQRALSHDEPEHTPGRQPVAIEGEDLIGRKELHTSSDHCGWHDTHHFLEFAEAADIATIAEDRANALETVDGVANEAA
jgi:hypothetical protein